MHAFRSYDFQDIVLQKIVMISSSCCEEKLADIFRHTVGQTAWGGESQNLGALWACSVGWGA